MILEVQKIKGQYIIKNPPKVDGLQFFLNIEKKNIMHFKPTRRKLYPTDVTFKKVEEMADMFPEDNLLQSLKKYYKPHVNRTEKTDDEVYHDYLMEKYGK